MHMLQSLFYLTTALHVSGVTSTHLQEHKTTVTTASGNRYTVLLSAAIVEELEPVWVCCGWCDATHNTPKPVGTGLSMLWVAWRHPQHTQTGSNSVTCASCWIYIYIYMYIYVNITRIFYPSPNTLPLSRLSTALSANCNIRHNIVLPLCNTNQQNTLFLN